MNERITARQRLDAMAGIDATQEALLALAQGDEDAVLEAIHGAEFGPLRYASRTLLALLWQAVLLLCDNDEARARQALPAVANGLEGNRAVLEAFLIVRDAEASDG